MIKLKDGVAAVRDVFANSGITPSAQTNTHVELGSDPEPPKRADGEYDGAEMPRSNALVSDRSRVLKDIATRRDAQIVENAEEGNKVIAGTAGDDNETLPPDSEIKGDDIPVDGETHAPAVETPPVVAPPEEMRTLIVDGKSIQVPVSKIIERGTATFQKETAADARLAEANRILEHAQRIAAQGQPSKDADLPQENVSAIAKLTPEERVRIIRYGTDEEAAQVQRYMEEQAARPQMKPEDIQREVRQAVGPQMTFEEGRKYVISEYGDLLKDPDLGAIFLNRENAARAAKDPRGYIELYKEIGEDMRKKFNRPKLGADGAALPTPKPVASTVPVRTMEEKRELKANAPSLPRLASSRLDGDANTPRPASRAEMFASMRRARGFQQGKDL